MVLVGRPIAASVSLHRKLLMVRAIPSNARCIHQLARRNHCPSIAVICEARPHRQQRRRSSEIPGGANLSEDTTNEERPKIALDAYAPTGFDVCNMIQKVDEEEKSESGGAVHMTGSILAFPRACFLWKIDRAEQITLESLAPVMVYRPKIKYLFLGCNTPIPPQELKRIRTELKSKAGIVAEQLTLVSLTNSNCDSSVVLLPPVNSHFSMIQLF
jgi:hypothetical protein